MESPKLNCKVCGKEISQETADNYLGGCWRCHPGTGTADGRYEGKDEEKFNIENIADSMEFGMRLLLAFVFGCVFCGLGYAAGAWIWSGIALLLALIFFPIGFVYGFFAVEINALIRFALRWLIKFHWG